jgi:hypothetical protein
LTVLIFVNWIYWFKKQHWCGSSRVLIFRFTKKQIPNFGKENATDEEVIEAAKAAVVYMITLPTQRNTKRSMNEESRFLSGQNAPVFLSLELLLRIPVLLLDLTHIWLLIRKRRVNLNNYWIRQTKQLLMLPIVFLRLQRW